MAKNPPSGDQPVADDTEKQRLLLQIEELNAKLRQSQEQLEAAAYASQADRERVALLEGIARPRPPAPSQESLPIAAPVPESGEIRVQVVTNYGRHSPGAWTMVGVREYLKFRRAVRD